MDCPHLSSGRCLLAEALIESGLDTALPVVARENFCRRCLAETPTPTVAESGPWPVNQAANAVQRAEREGTLPAGSLPRFLDRFGSRLRRVEQLLPQGPRGVGWHLQHLIATRFGWPPCQLCHETARAMDALGPEGCRRELDRLVRQVERNSQMVLNSQADLKARVLRLAPGAFKRAGIRRLILEAIQLAESESVPSPPAAAEKRASPPPFPAGAERRVTIGVTAFDRPQALRQCLRSIAQHAPGARVVIADNGRHPVDPADAGLDPAHVTYIRLPYDCGLSAARNALIDQLATDCLLLLEDDGQLTAETNVGALLDVLDSSPEIGVVGFPFRMADGRTWGHPAALDGTRVRVRQDLPVHHTPAGTPYTLAEAVWNFALFRADFLRDHRWHPDLRVGEHFEFYWRVQETSRWLVAHTTACFLFHDTATPESSDYQARRGRARALHGESVRKWRGRALPTRLTPQTSRAVLVVGTGLCGTSAVAEVLHRLGVPMGVRFLPPDPSHPRGYWEDLWALRLCQTRDWRGLSRLISHRVTTRPVWGLKQPRLADHWEQIAALPWPEDLRIVLCSRDRAQVVASHQARYGVSPDQSQRLIDARLTRLAALRLDAQARGWPVLEIDFADLLRDPSAVTARLAEFSGVPLVPSAAAAIDTSLSAFSS